MTTTTTVPIANPNRRQSTTTNSQYYYATTTPSHYFPSTSPSVIKGCCCCLFLLFSLLALITLAVILIILLAIKPKKPHFDLQQVTVQYVGIDPTTTASASLSLSIRLLFTAQNPNKVGIKYGTSKFTIMYRGIPLGKGVVPGFYQPQHSQTTVETIVTVDHVSLTQADASEIIKEASVYDKVEFRVIGDVSAKIRIISLDSPAVSVSVACAIVISPRRQALAYKQCGFDGLSV